MVNFFFLDRDMAACARSHGDKHLNKMVLEAAQLCSTIWHCVGADTDQYTTVRTSLYKKTHAHHPVVLWGCRSIAHYTALAKYGLALAQEKRNRMAYMATLPKKLQRSWKPEHASEPLLHLLHDNPPPLTCFPEGNQWSDPPLCMPDYYRTETDAVTAYRLYYAGSKVDVTGLKWEPYAREPEWLDQCRERIKSDPVLKRGLEEQQMEAEKKKRRKAT